MSSWRSGSAAKGAGDEKGTAAVRILVLSPTFLPVVGGAELLLLGLCRRLSARHEVRLLTPSLPDSLVREQGSEEYDSLVTFPVERYHDRVSFMKIPGHRWTAGAIPPFSLSAVTAVWRAVKAFRPQVLNVHYLMPTGLAGLVAERWLGVPTVVTLNGRDVPGPGVPALWRWWQRALLACVSDATFISRYCRDAICGSGSEQGHIVHAGVDMPSGQEDAGSLRRRLDIPEGEPVIFSLQRLGREKRVEMLLRAFHHCYRQTGTGVLVLGGKGPEEPALRALVEELGIDKQVRLAGYIPQQALGSFYSGCDLFAFHSTFETFGVALAQAMAYGKPVVTVRNTALPEVVGDGGLIAETGDWRGLGGAMARVITDQPLRTRLGQAARQRAQALFDWDRIVEQHEAVLAQAAGKSGHAA